MADVFKDTLDDDLDNVFFNNNEFSENATFTATGGSPVPFTVKVIFDNEFSDPQPDTDQPLISRQPMVRVDEAVFLAALTREPIDGDQINFRSTDYKVVDFRPDGVGTAILILHEV